MSTQQPRSFRRLIAGLQSWWLRLFVVSVILAVLDVTPYWWGLVASVVFIALALVRPPHADAVPVAVTAPLRGRWVPLNGPCTKVPSHGVLAYAQKYAVDLLHPIMEAPDSLGWGLKGRPPESYTCFGEPVLALMDGTVVAGEDGQRDHAARSTWPTLIWMMTFGGFLRELWGVHGMLGNHVIIQHGDVFSAYAHLRRGSAQVTVGQEVAAGHVLAEVGNTGNTSEPHLHVQLMDRANLNAAAGLPMQWEGIARDTGQRDPRLKDSTPKPTAQPGFPTDGQIIEL